MTPTQFNLRNDPDSQCYAVYTDGVTKLIERALIVSPVLYESPKTKPHIIVSLHPEGFYKSLPLYRLDDLIVSKLQWMAGDKLDNSQRKNVS